MGLKSIDGEIVQVQGGHIIRATGRKDRHSKVFTAKGPRDRRVRLAAHTAIEFYDVQDRLGYDRPSKAVDWLITKAKDSIDKLAELPPWDPISCNNGAAVAPIDGNVSVSEQMSQFYVDSGGGGGGGGDGMKSFFPTNNNDISGDNSNFPNYPQGFVRGSHQNHQDLCLSLHTLEDPGVTVPSESAHHTSHDDEHGLFNGFDGGGGWAQQQDVGRFTRLMGWAGDSSGGGGGCSGEGRGGIMFSNNNNNSSPLFLSTMANYGNTQRGALQSNYSSMTRDFEDNHIHNHNHNHNYNSNNHQVISGMGHGSDSFMGFYIPSQIHGDLHGGGDGASMSNRASSSSLSSHSTPH